MNFLHELQRREEHLVRRVQDCLDPDRHVHRFKRTPPFLHDGRCHIARQYVLKLIPATSAERTHLRVLTGTSRHHRAPHLGWSRNTVGRSSAGGPHLPTRTSGRATRPVRLLAAGLRRRVRAGPAEAAVRRRSLRWSGRSSARLRHELGRSRRRGRSAAHCRRRWRHAARILRRCRLREARRRGAALVPRRARTTSTRCRCGSSRHVRLRCCGGCSRHGGLGRCGG